ncbi:MAG TPA: VOC family protein [Candidatus Angelobacter sp.]|nr:VOC family protein [Candidatus Angelobacter sp.]
MANSEKHPAGSFCWVELATVDQEAAKKFYTALFGWTIVDSPIGPSDYYTTFKLSGLDTGAAYSMRKEQRAQGVPPHWMLYIAVENADQAVTKVAQIGGTVLAPAFDVMDIGRMAVVQDPTGGIFSLWQAKKESGIATTGNNTFCWADLSTPQPDAAAKFYSALFGWQIVKDEKDPSGYMHIKNGENFIGGIPPAEHRNPNAPPHWLLYFQVADVKAAAANTAKLGGKILMPARDMENVGTWAVVADPQGAAFALFKSAR